MNDFKIGVNKFLLVLFAMLMMGTSIAFAQTITLPSPKGLIGAPAEDYNITVTNLGTNVRAYQFVLTYDPLVMTVESASISGTISSDGQLQQNPQSGVFSVAWAGNNGAAIPVTSGTLIKLRIRFLALGPTTLSVGSTFLLNATPQVVADTQARGSNITLSIGSVTGPINTDLLIPVNTSALGAGDNVRSFNFTVNYDPARLQIVGLEQAGTLGAAGQSQFGTASGLLSVAWANSIPIQSGVPGTLIYIKARLLQTGSTTVTLNEASFQFNAGTPTAVVTIPVGTITSQNRAPVFGAVTAALEIQETQTVAFTVTATDPDGDTPLTYGISGKPAAATFNTSTGAFSWTTGYTDAGVYPVTFTVQDPGLLSPTPVVVTITVTDKNRAPVISLNPATAIYNVNALTPVGPITVIASDDDGDVPVVTPSNMPPTGATFVGGVFNYLPPAHLTASFTPTFTADDGKGGTATVSFTINVTGVNTAPRFDVTGATQMPDITITEGQLLTFDYKAIDAEGDVVSYFKVDPTPPASTIVNSGTDAGKFSWTPVLGDAGIKQVVVMASDGSLTSASRITNVTVLPAQPPTFTLTPVAPYSWAEKTAYSIVVAGTDPQGLALTYSATGLPQGAAFDPATKTLSWTPEYGQSRTAPYAVTFSVRNALGLTTTQSIEIVVTKTNVAPTLTAGGPYSTTEGVKVEFTLVGADVNPGDVLSYSGVGLPTGVTVDPTSGLVSWTPVVGQAGTHTLTFNVSDGVLTTSATAVVTVNAAGNPVVVVSGGAAQTIAEKSALTIDLSVTDPSAGQTYTYAVVGTLPIGAAFDPATKKFTWTPEYGQSSATPYNVTFKVTNSPLGLSGEATVAITVTKTNVAPTLTVDPAAVTKNENELVTITLTPADINPGETFTYSSVAALPGGSISAGGVFTWTPNYLQAGSYTINFKVTDSDGLSATAAAVITVNDVNRTPTLVLDPATLTVNGGTNLTINLLPADVDTDNTLTLTVASLPAGASFDAAGKKMTWKPGYHLSGTFSPVFTVTDNYGATASATATITVLPVNTAPQYVVTGGAQMGDVTVVEGEKLTFNFKAIDAEEDVVTYYKTDPTPKDSKIDAATGAFEWTPAKGQAGEYQVVIIASDGSLSTTSRIAKVTVTAAPNTAPVVTLTPASPYTVKVGAELVIQVSVVDAENDPLTFTVSDAPKGASFDPLTGKVKWTPAVDQVGTYNVKLIVSDSWLSTTVTAAITVTANASPVVTLTPAAPYSVKVGSSISITVSATDEEGDALTYSAYDLPAGATFDAATMKLTWAPTVAQVGNHTAKFTVADPYTATTVTAAITVTANASPVVTLAPAAPYTVAENATITITVSATDAESDALTYSASGLPAGAAFDAATKKLTWKPDYGTAGSYTVKFMVADAYSTTTVNAVITVTQTNRAPSIAFDPAGPSFAVDEGKTLTFKVVGSDLDKGDVVTLSVGTLPSGATFSAATGVFTWTPNYTQAGTVNVGFTATDVAKLTAQKIAVITVNNVVMAPSFVVTGGRQMPDTTIKGGVNLIYPYKAIDPAGLTVSYVLQDPKPANAVMVASTGVFQWRPANSQGGKWPIVVIASNGLLSTTSRISYVTVVPDLAVEDEGVPTSYNLYQNYPNPFNPSTSIKFALPKDSKVRLSVYNILGQEMVTLVDEFLSAGYHSVKFDATNLTSGMYIYKIDAENFTQIRKMLLMK